MELNYITSLKICGERTHPTMWTVLCCFFKKFPSHNNNLIRRKCLSVCNLLIDQSICMQFPPPSLPQYIDCQHLLSVRSSGYGPTLHSLQSCFYHSEHTRLVWAFWSCSTRPSSTSRLSLAWFIPISNNLRFNVYTCKQPFT